MIPALLAYKAKKGNLVMIGLVFLFGVCTAVFHFLSMYEMLPMFKG
ncbi:ttryptophan-specific transport protein [Actinobacillus pleuropneumoniae]|nr:ttryptophan-specific transport protein [Actinobacillus pleuropneumoniae]